jgi:hypothetical protein
MTSKSPGPIIYIGEIDRLLYLHSHWHLDGVSGSLWNRQSLFLSACMYILLRRQKFK